VHATEDDVFDFSATLVMLSGRLRRLGRPDLGALPGVMVGLVATITGADQNLLEVAPIDPSREHFDKFVLEPIDHAAFDVVLETTEALRPATSLVRPAFAPRYRFKPEAARLTTARLGLLARDLPIARLRLLVGYLDRLWANFAQDSATFREIADALDEIHAYFEMAVYMNRASGRADALD